jgi:uncharacterized protein YkwD
VRRRLAVLTLILAVLLLPGTAFAASSSLRHLSPPERDLLHAVNNARRTHGLQPLKIDLNLTRAARFQSRRLLERNVLDHGDLATRLKRFGVTAALCGENLAWGTPAEVGAGAIVRAWLASPGHRANLLRPTYRRIGLGAAFGTFAGYTNSTVATADFAGT